VRELEKALALRKQAEDELRRLNAKLTREISERKQAENAVNEQELATICIYLRNKSYSSPDQVPPPLTPDNTPARGEGTF
jgi:hypothetical protein